MTQKKIKIPATIEEATTDLDGLSKLLTAKEWERAAIVYAFTRDGQGERTDLKTSSTSTGSLTITAFADLGIAGLKSDRTVREYRKAWQSAIEDGAPDVKPGDTIDVPHLPWPPGIIDHGRGSHATKEEVVKGFRKMVKDDPQEAFRAVVDTPEMADAVVEGAVEAPGVDWRMEERLREKRHKQDEARAAARVTPTRQTPPREVVEKVIKAVDSFFRTTITHNGRTLTYEDVIDEVVAIGPVPELGAMSIRPHWLGEDLSQALQTMSRTAATKVQALGEPPAVAIGAKEIEE